MQHAVYHTMCMPERAEMQGVLHPLGTPAATHLRCQRSCVPLSFLTRCTAQAARRAPFFLT